MAVCGVSSSFSTECPFCSKTYRFPVLWRNSSMFCSLCRHDFSAVEKKSKKGSIAGGAEERSEEEPTETQGGFFQGFKRKDKEIFRPRKGKHRVFVSASCKESSISMEAAKDETEVKEKPGFSKDDQTSSHATSRSSSILSFNVPDADFCDFDLDRTENHLRVGQIWAIYDDESGMPRYYGRIASILVRKKLNFCVQIVWLHAVNAPASALFSPACGMFEDGSWQTINSVAVFSHLVEYTICGGQFYSIFPRKGQVWAVFKNSGSTQKDFQMVEITESFGNCHDGGCVTCLNKVEGYKSVYQREKAMQWVPANDLVKFSHRVPAKRLLGDKVPNFLWNCWELDLAAL